MICKNCGNNIPEGSKFCEKCGSPAGEGVQYAGSVQNVQYTVPQNGAAAVPKKKSKKKIALIAAAVVILLIVIIAVVSGDENNDSVYVGDGDTEYIDVVKTGMPYAYPDQTWGEELDILCGDSGKWSTFIGADDDLRYVEFNGTVSETDEKLCIQWRCDEPDDDLVEFEIMYIEIDGENYSTEDGINSMIVYVFEGQYEE